MNAQIAEICGIHAGDGYLRDDGKRREWDVSGSIEEKVYYDQHVIPLVATTFSENTNGKFFLSRGTYGFVIRNRDIIAKIHSLGFPYGNKTLIVKSPEFITKGSLEMKAAFLRGIFDTDGCVTFMKRYAGYREFKKTHHVYPRINITTVSKPLLEDLKQMLTDLGVKFWCQEYMPKNPKEHKRYILWVRGVNVVKWMRIIGSNNPIKQSRYEIWEKFGFCPTNTTYAQRLSILAGKLNPEEL